MNREEPEYKVGDQVRWTAHARHGYTYTDHGGAITRISDKGTLHVKCYDGEERKVMRSRSKYGRRYDCDLLTAHEIAEREWSARRPKTTIISVSRGWGYRESDDSTSVTIVGASGRSDIAARASGEKFSDNLRRASAELDALASWWDSRPSAEDFEPTTETVTPVGCAWCGKSDCCGGCTQ